jgi:GT2 family glycosyltransferase
MPHSKNLNKEWPLVSVFIPCYNGMKFLPVSLASILELDYPNLELLIIDDCSTDGSAQFIQKNFPQFKLIRNNLNLGFVSSVNNGFWHTSGKYFFMVNQDTVHQPDYLKKCVEKMESDQTIGVIGGKVYKYDFENRRSTTIIDTVGEKLFLNRRVIDEGQGEMDQGQFDQPGEVFAISGQNPLYRRSALLSIAIPITGQAKPELFDQDFYMYKEDVDVGWRLRLFGWKAWYNPTAIAWHGRSTAAVKRTRNSEIVENRHLLSNFHKFHSIKNRYLLILKNDSISHLIKHSPFIIWTEILYFGYNLVFDTKNIRAYFAALKKIPQIWPKRKWIQKHRKVSAKQFQEWFN